MDTFVKLQLRTSMRLIAHISFCLLALISALPAGAATSVAYSSLDASGGYDYATGRAINGSSFRYGYQAWAYRFVAGQGGPLGNIELAVQYALFDSGPGDQVDVRLARDTDGLFMNATTLTAGAVTLTSSFGSGDLRTFTPSGPVTLTAGGAYWLAVTPHSSSTVADWCVSSTGATGKYALSLDGVNWIQDQGAPFSAFRVNIGVVPEPTVVSLGLLGAGVLLGFPRGLRQR
jgi:hypothetical protein